MANEMDGHDIPSTVSPASNFHHFHQARFARLSACHEGACADSTWGALSPSIWLAMPYRESMS
jgi:hypothetical protein